MGWTERVVEHLADEGHRLTGPRRAILEHILRYSAPFTAEDRARQLEWRGLYAEFNLIYDRGTLFGLKTGGNVDAILMSLPPEATWR